MRSSLPAIWLAAWGLLPTSALPADIAIDHSEIGASTAETSDATRARAWGLDDAEWDRYRSLLQGPLGLRLPNVDPLLALLMESDDPAEQRRYAEQLARQETDYWNRLLNANRLYQEAHARLYPDTAARRMAPPLKPGGRLLFFIPRDCPVCREPLPRLVERAGQGIASDLFFLDRGGEAVRAWARDVAAEVEGLEAAIASGSITLNVEGGQLAQLGGTAPAFFHRAPNGVITALEAAP